MSMMQELNVTKVKQNMTTKENQSPLSALTVEIKKNDKGNIFEILENI